MSVNAELSYLEFHNTKGKLASGFYRVVEADGELSYARVKANDSGVPSAVTWLSEDEYLDLRRQDQELLDLWDADYNEFNRMNPDDLAEVDANHNSELFDKVVYGIEPTESQVNDEPVERRSVSEPKTLGEILREFKGTDVRDMSESQYAEHCEVADQNRRDGV